MTAHDSALVQRALSGDPDAFGGLIECHRPMTLRLAGRMLNDAAEAEDVTQEACLHAFLTLDRLRDAERFGAWLCGIVVNLCRMRLRARRTTYALEDWDGGRVPPDFTWADVQPSPEATYELYELHQRVSNAITALPAEQQEMVRLHYLDGLRLSEIEMIAGVPLGTVKARLHRARQRLRAELVPVVLDYKRIHKPTEEAKMIEMIVHEVVMRVGKVKDVLEAASREQPGPEMKDVRKSLPSDNPLMQRVVLLKERHGERILPIWIGPHEADMLALQLAEKAPFRPVTYDLITRLLEAAHMTVERVAVSRVHEDVYYATLWVRAGSQIQEVDARPSDALNLALRVNAPVFADESVLAQCGVEVTAVWEKLETHAWKDHEAERVVLEDARAAWQSVPPPDVSPPAK